MTDADAVRRAYDDLADDYDLNYADWRTSSRRQGGALDAVLTGELPDADGRLLRILDCAAGIGTQLLGLAALGHECAGTDLSTLALRRARAEAAAARMPAGSLAGLAAADMRRLPFAGASFDAVVCADNALPHLLTRDDVLTALREMLRVTVPGGAVVVSTRDYDELLAEPPTVDAAARRTHGRRRQCHLPAVGVARRRRALRLRPRHGAGQRGRLADEPSPGDLLGADA